MKKLAIVIMQNQNEVNIAEIEKIRRAVKAEFPKYRNKIISNETQEVSDVLSSICDEVIQFSTSDVNYKVSASYVCHQSSLIFRGKGEDGGVKLN